MNLLRCLPSVDSLLQGLERVLPLGHGAPRVLRHALSVDLLEERRRDIRAGLVTEAAELEFEALLAALAARVLRAGRPSLRPAINAAGVVIHTNMGRAPLADEAVEAVLGVAGGYSTLELDPRTGGRGSRQSHVERLLCRLTGAEAALVVNNNAAAVFLALDALCRGREVPVSRGQLVEIGGGFRIPEIMEKSGATLREVGATNRTSLEDFRRALNERTAALLRVHPSNFRIIGFTAEPDPAELAQLAHEQDLPLIEDLGSGCLVDLAPFGLPGEPTVAEVVARGADVVTFSGDKLLGGPQAGVICGRTQWLEPIRSNPLLRALRVDKFTLAGLEATLRLYLEPERALERIPVLAQLTASAESLARRARSLRRLLAPALEGLADLHLVRGASAVGGGAFPGHDLPTTLVAVAPRNCSAGDLRQRLLDVDPPVIGRVDGKAFLLDPRCLRHAELAPLRDGLRAALTPRQAGKSEARA